MKPIAFALFLSCSLFLLWSCGSDSNTPNNVTFPKELTQPEGIRFDFLMYENGYNAVPEGANHHHYAREFQYSESSGMCFKLDETRRYAPGLNGIVKTPRKGEWYKTSFACFKEIANKPDITKGVLVVSYSRGDSTTSYEKFILDDLLEAQNKQIIGKWEDISVWYKIPDFVEAGDRLQIYHWNPQGGPLYIDNFVVEVWTDEPLAPNDVALSHPVYEQNYETSDLANQSTKETAARGLYSCILSGLPKHKAYGAGYQKTLGEANIQAGDYIKVTFAALKKHKVRQHSSASCMVMSLERGQQQLFWEGLSVDPRIVKDGKQAYGEWVRLEAWQKIPDDAQASDLLKVYPWNNLPNPIYIDDILIEVWRPNTSS